MKTEVKQSLENQFANKKANDDKAEKNASKTIRDKAYIHLKALVDEIREAGKYVFRNNKNRLKGYSNRVLEKTTPKTKQQSGGSGLILMSCILLGRPVSMWGALLVFTPPCMDFMLSCAAGLQNNTAGRVKTLQKSPKTLQEQKKVRRNDKKRCRDTKKTTETGKIATGRQKRLQENKKMRQDNNKSCLF